MPYRTVKDLPQNVLNPLPSPAQKIWLKTFNSALKSCINSGNKESDCEDVARIAAWVQVRTRYKKGPDGVWIPKKNK